jgi:predicted enzyme related to lactoylglutathione lyase
MFQRVSPILPVRDVEKALEHDRRLGFDSRAYPVRDGGELIYGFVGRAPVELHLALASNLDPEQNTSACYLYVDDADALHAQWSAARAGGRMLGPPVDTGYGLREFAYVDPDGNLLRVGSARS